MNQTIWKFPLAMGNLIEIEMPKAARILSVQAQSNEPMMWALVRPDIEKEKRYFETFGTGHNVPYYPDKKRIHIGTYQINAGIFVFHVFELKSV